MDSFQLDLPEGDFDALLFDCDGTLVHSMPLHYHAWKAGFEAAGAPYAFPEATFYGYAGVKEEEIVRRMNELHSAEVDADEVVRAKAAFFAGHFEELEEVTPVADYAREMTGEKAMAVVSGSEESHVRRCLEVTTLDSLFEVVVTPSDVAPGRGKPHPDMFLLAAERLGFAPEKCLVFEDGQSGIDAATAAGMASVFVPTGPSDS